MKLSYENVDITRDVDIHSADLIDSSGGKSDSIELYIVDNKGLWNHWKPQKNHKLNISMNGLSSGNMYIDEIEQIRGMFILRALSFPQEAKTSHTQAWESVRFLEFVSELTNRYGFSLETYGIENYLYNRVDQVEQTDFSFLSWRCTLEGYLLKITDNKVIIYSEEYMEQLDSARDIEKDQVDGKYKFLTTSTNIFNSCKFTYGNIKSEFKPVNAPYGPQLKYSDIYAHSKGESDRYCKNLLRSANKFEHTGSFGISLDTGIAATNNVNLSGFGIADGKYFCNKVTHRFIQGKTILKMRRPLEGY